MQLLAVRQARLIAFLNAEELNPEGRPLAHDFINAFVERYSFLKRPTPEDLLGDKGVVFELGRLGDVGIDKISLFDWGIAVDTSASTEASEGVLQDMLRWGAENFKLSNRPNLVTRRAYVSELVISSDVVLPTINPRLQDLGNRITELVTGYGSQSMPYEIVGVGWGFDASQSKQLITPFRVERLAEMPFSEKKYYSGAPLRTSDHIQVINDLEAALKG